MYSSIGLIFECGHDSLAMQCTKEMEELLIDDKKVQINGEWWWDSSGKILVAVWLTSNVARVLYHQFPFSSFHGKVCRCFCIQTVYYDNQCVAQIWDMSCLYVTWVFVFGCLLCVVAKVFLLLRCGLTYFHSRWDARPAPKPDSAWPRFLWRWTLRGGRWETTQCPAHPCALPQLPG